MPICAAMLDVDHFKRVNDTYGHLAGDVALRQLGKLLAQAFPPPYICGRYGGEEFGVVDPTGDAALFVERLEALRATVEATPVNIGDLSFSITVSIGMATQQQGKIEDLFSAADALLYTAKNQGRNRLATAPPMAKSTSDGAI